MQDFSESTHTPNHTPAAFRIAVLEDDAALREMWSWVLEDEGYPVQAYANPVQFLAALEQGEQLDLLLLDLGLPPEPDTPECGLALLEQLMSVTPGLKVLVLTGQNQQANIFRAVRAGAFDFLAKPVAVDHLLLSVRRAQLFQQQEARLMDEGARRLTIDAPTDQGMKAVRNEAEKRLLVAVLHETDFNVHEMARRLGIKRENVYYLLKKYDLSRN
ncbi:MAG: response regulator [Marinobacterium sp.]|nr:response regulator [Marinobacterium sp.]